MPESIAVVQMPSSGLMPLLGTVSAFVALAVVGFVGGLSAMMVMSI